MIVGFAPFNFFEQSFELNNFLHLFDGGLGKAGSQHIKGCVLLPGAHFIERKALSVVDRKIMEIIPVVGSKRKQGFLLLHRVEEFDKVMGSFWKLLRLQLKAAA